MTAAAIGLIALVAFSTEGAIGFGGTVITACLGAQLVLLPQLLPAFLPVSLGLSAYLAWNGRDAIAWRVLLVTIAPPVAIGAAIGIMLFHGATWLVPAFGGFVAVLAVLQLVRRPLPFERTFLVLGGIAHGLFGTGGPMVVYVARRRIADKRAFRATLAVLWLVLGIALLVNYLSLGLYTRGTAELGGAIAIALAPGLWIGERLHRALDAAKFERAVWWLLLVAGLVLALE